MSDQSDLKDNSKWLTKKTQIIIFALTLCAIIMIGIASAEYLATLTLSNTGNVVTDANLTAYSDVECQNQISNIAWGDVMPGQSYTQQIYLKNSGNTAETLSMTVSGLTTGLSLSWNCEGDTLQSNVVKSVTFTLTVEDVEFADSVTPLSFQTSINGAYN